MKEKKILPLISCRKIFSGNNFIPYKLLVPMTMYLLTIFWIGLNSKFQECLFATCNNVCDSEFDGVARGK